MKVEVFEHGAWRELEQVRRGASDERRVISLEKQQPPTVAAEAPYRVQRLLQVREDIKKIGPMSEYSLDWLNPPPVVVVREQPKPPSAKEILFDLLFGWLADRTDNKKE